MSVENSTWDKIRWSTPDNREKVSDIWQLFHENSKIGKFDYFPSKEEVVKHMKELSQTLSYPSHDKIELPRDLCPFDLSLEETLVKRRSALSMKPEPLSLAQIGTILHFSYGISQDNQFERPFRVAPSAGALYPLDLFLYVASSNQIASGIYYYNPLKHHLSVLRQGDFRQDFASKMPDAEISFTSSLIIFIVAQFEKTVFKYSNRGYRFALMEAGHVAQNIDLTSTALNLKVKNIGGYFDREIDEFLGFDGIMQSTLYMTAIGV